MQFNCFLLCAVNSSTYGAKYLTSAREMSESDSCYVPVRTNGRESHICGQLVSTLMIPYRYRSGRATMNGTKALASPSGRRLGRDATRATLQRGTSGKPCSSCGCGASASFTWQHRLGVQYSLTVAARGLDIRTTRGAQGLEKD
jgi:hypothetical protein